MAPPKRQKGHTTLSDLLADDVRDYFLREGVPENPPTTTTPTAKSNRRQRRKGGSDGSSGNKSKRGNSNSERGSRQSSDPTPSLSVVTSGAVAPSSVGPFRLRWITATPSASDSPRSFGTFKLGGGDDDAEDDVQGFHQQTQQYHYHQKYQHHNQQQQQHQEQQAESFKSVSIQPRGQPTSERHSLHPVDHHNINPYNKNHQLHRRHDSGSGSFHSKSSLQSNGSQSSRGKVVSAVDAEFLKRYAEDKQMTNARMSGTRLDSIDGKDHVGAGLGTVGAYHTLIQAPRPPTVAGSHRPALPSIDNDDWEEDDRLERKDQRKLERKETRRLLKEQRKRTNSDGESIRSIGALSVNTALSVVYHHPNSDAHSIGTAKGSVVYHNSNREDAVPEPSDIMRMSSQEGSVMSHGSVGITPGSERYESGSSTLCYSTGSSQLNSQQKQHSLHLTQHGPPEFPFHNRVDSGGTFVRRSSLNLKPGSGDNGMNNGNNGHGQMQREQYLQQETTIKSHHNTHRTNKSLGEKKKTRHVRPLSYLSASSDSGKESESLLSRDRCHDSNNHHFQHQNSSSTTSPSTLFGQRISPHSSNGGATRVHPLQNSTHRLSSMSLSDMNSSLLGSDIIDSAQSGDSMRSTLVKSRDQVLEVGVGRWYQQEQQHHHRYDDDEESSDGSHDSSGHSSDSYYGDSSSSQTSSELQHQRHPPPRYQTHQQHSSPRKGVRWEPPKFKNDNPRFNYRDNGDIEGGMTPSNERARLSYGDRNAYATMDQTTIGKSSYKPRKQNRTFNRNTTNKHRLGGPGCVPLRLDDAIEALWEKMNRLVILMELFISNMPSLVGSLALAWCSLGVDWFKWYEETFDACHPVPYHSEACVFTEFPGCFECETTRRGYQFALHFHYFCSTVAFILSSFLVGKLMIAFPVVRDELANPATAAPLGLLCMAFEKMFAGNFGYVGEGITFIAAGLHTAVAGWFIFISVVYKTLPEPSWFSNTTGIGLAAAKIYLYWTDGGYFLSGLSVLAFVMFYVVSLYRIHTNEKISAPVCWVQLSGPAVVLYGFTMFSQPGTDEDHLDLLIQENKNHFYQVHRTLYMPIVNLLFVFCMISMASALYLIRSKWRSFGEREFSPAHLSFGAPLVSHANAMQAYRSSLSKFSRTPPDTTFKLWLYYYWTLSLICGTVLVVVLTWKFVVYLPSWCHINVDDDEMPPEPDETIVTQLLQKGEAGDSMNQHFVSAAVLQANESGALVRVLQDGKMKYVRSRRMPSMGFDPIMNVSELMSERERLLQYVTYAASPSLDRGGLSSFDDTVMETFTEPDRLRASSGRQRLNFMSFVDASTAMRGHH